MKHIVCVIDGTWQTPTARRTDENFSNAYSLNWMLDTHTKDGSDQVVFYFSGLGTDRRSQPYTGGAFARGLDHQIAEAYINIASNYRAPAGKDPDKIYIFGFSRGSVAARAIAGMISHCGLLEPSKIDHYHQVWNTFVRGKPVSAKLRELCYSDVEIEFVGVFDTVFGNHTMSATFNELEFPNLDLPPAVKVGVHLLAIDETRRFFAPMLWERCEKHQVLEQIWMPGVHSDVGGVYGSHYLGSRALRSMIDRVLAYTELCFNRALLGNLDAELDRPALRAHVNNELVSVWRILPKLKRQASKTAQNQYLHPAIRELLEVESTYKRRVNAYYEIDSFLGGVSLPYLNNWHSMRHRDTPV